MSRQLDLVFCRPLISSAAGFPAKTSAAQVQASEVASLVLAAACGLNSSASFESFTRLGSWSKTSPAARMNGLTASSQDWQARAMRAYRSRLRRLMSERSTGERECSSLLPTLTRKANLLAPYMQRWPAHRRLVERMRAGGVLSPTWCEWLMGFPEDWTALEPESQHSVTPSCRSAQK
jgi:hypothetical protein